MRISLFFLMLLTVPAQASERFALGKGLRNASDVRKEAITTFEKKCGNYIREAPKQEHREIRKTLDAWWEEQNKLEAAAENLTTSCQAFLAHPTELGRLAYTRSSRDLERSLKALDSMKFKDKINSFSRDYFYWSKAKGHPIIPRGECGDASHRLWLDFGQSRSNIETAVKDECERPRSKPQS